MEPERGTLVLEKFFKCPECNHKWGEGSYRMSNDSTSYAELAAMTEEERLDAMKVSHAVCHGWYHCSIDCCGGCPVCGR